jgi:peptide chain release factor 1
LSAAFFDKLEKVERKFERLTADLSSPDDLGDSTRLQKVAKERSSLEKLVETFRTYKKELADLQEEETLLNGSDADLRAMAKEMLPELGAAGKSSRKIKAGKRKSRRGRWRSAREA